jgi:hypothetical protein
VEKKSFGFVAREAFEVFEPGLHGRSKAVYVRERLAGRCEMFGELLGALLPRVGHANGDLGGYGWPDGGCVAAFVAVFAWHEVKRTTRRLG